MKVIMVHLTIPLGLLWDMQHMNGEINNSGTSVGVPVTDVQLEAH